MHRCICPFAHCALAGAREPAPSQRTSLRPAPRPFRAYGSPYWRTTSDVYSRAEHTCAAQFGACLGLGWVSAPWWSKASGGAPLGLWLPEELSVKRWPQLARRKMCGNNVPARRQISYKRRIDSHRRGTIVVAAFGRISICSASHTNNNTRKIQARIPNFGCVQILVSRLRKRS